MESRERALRAGIRYRFVRSYVMVALGAALVVESVVLWALTSQLPETAPSRNSLSLHVALVLVGVGCVSAVLGMWASRGVTRRVQRALAVSRAWLRGNLSLRVADPLADEVGMLTQGLDLLAERFEQNGQDLDELRERNSRLTDQVRALTLVEERNRLARELHDSVKQHLFSLAMTVGAVRTRLKDWPDLPADVSEMVDEIEVTAQTAQREMTRLIGDLHLGSLQQKGLAAALNDYTLLLGAREHLLIYLEVQGNDQLLPPPMAESLYRVTQEALHNVVRHARATRADVQFRCLPEQAILMIRDNGIGFDTGLPDQGLGMANMLERVMAIGGRLTVDSHVGVGTTVLAEVGLPHPAGTAASGARLDSDRPVPTIENWAWLGRKLVIPVGQTWPWLYVDQLHLRRSLVEPDDRPLVFAEEPGFLGLRRDHVLRLGQSRKMQVGVHRSRSGCEWESEGASWALRHVRGLGGRMVLTRNGQPLAAMQQQGLLLHTWTEIVHDGRGYRLSQVGWKRHKWTLEDETGEQLLVTEGSEPLQIMLHRGLPLSLLLMVAVRVVDELSGTAGEEQSVT